MPIYNYHCDDCNKEFEVMHSMTEECTECGFCLSSNVARVVSSIGNKIDKSKFKNKAGDLVKSHIEEAKAEVKKEKEEMKNKVFTDD